MDERMIVLKKWITFISGTALALGLAACGEAAEPVAEAEVEQNATSDMKLEEVFNKSMEAAEQVDSLHADIITEQNMKMLPDGMEIDMTIESATDMVTEPSAFHYKAETTMASDDIENENPTLMEMYLTEEGMFMYEASMDTWLRMPDDSVEDLKIFVDQQTANPEEQLKDLAPFKDDFAVDQNEEVYILTMDASGEKFQTTLFEQLKKTLGQMELETPLSKEDLDVHSVGYKLCIDKETFLVNSLTIDMVADLKIDEETMAIQSNVKADYSQYNEIEEIVLPEEVLQQAEENE
ncbi:hypothetical protein QWY14_15945 [Planococcus sp. N028]|uniref:Lipoprotein n=1 Tax=Planococcus shixiaomingii TaxID=3058393 RepID=A0ABT8N5Y5_9BACL|nr:DUF6612 family protein [Planococcus sp. N028]MDN7243297.1 hypothetical protein [Planococcus sp. N028]